MQMQSTLSWGAVSSILGTLRYLGTSRHFEELGVFPCSFKYFEVLLCTLRYFWILFEVLLGTSDYFEVV